jgi:hypothetical protein
MAKLLKSNAKNVVLKIAPWALYFLETFVFELVHG